MNLENLTVTTGNAAGEAASFRRVSGFTELLNDPATVARSSPRRSDSVPSLYLTGNYVSLFGNLFRQIIPLSIWYTPTHGTILSLQAPTFYTTAVTDTRHSGCYVARYSFAICSFLTGPILSVGLSFDVVAHVYGRALGFFQHPRSRS